MLRGSGAKDVAVRDAQREEPDQGHQDQREGSGAGIDETCVIDVLAVGGAEAASTNAGPGRESDSGDQDDQKYCHKKPKKEAWTLSGSASSPLLQRRARAM